MSIKRPTDSRRRRHFRARKRISGSPERPRLAVFRSNRHISAQLIDDVAGRTLASVSTTQPSLQVTATGNTEAATKIGTAIAEKAKSMGIDKVVFDRGGFIYHGRIAAVAEAARAAGLKF